LFGRSYKTSCILENSFLKTEIYNSQMNIPVDIFDAYSRFSLNNNLQQSTSEYADKLNWVNELQNA
jgi:hypothetical protein